MESLQKKLATARETTDYEALEVVQKTIDNLQRQFQDEVPKLQDAFPCFCVHFFCCVLSFLCGCVRMSNTFLLFQCLAYCTPEIK